ncbi:MAG TPA: amino acid permease [Alphaproteobacteria bacterium]|jgi:GABA permease|nr:amino acid permease [Alphaproteobacteria bacterium]
MIAFGGIIGAGLFVGSSAAINIAGPAVTLSYAGSGLLVFLVMRMLGEMVVARPGHGSFAEYAALSLGKWAGFLTGWLYAYFWIITVGVETIAGAKLLQPWLEAAGMGLPIWAIGLVLISIMTLTNLMSVKAYGEFEFWFALLKVSAVALFVVIGLAFLLVFGPGLATAWANLTGQGGLTPKGAGAVLAAVPVTIFSMMGSEVATLAASESTDPAQNVARAARTVALRIVVFYVLSIAIIVAAVPWQTVTPGYSPFITALAAMRIPGGAAAMSVIAIIAVLSCLNSGLYVTSRMLYELARSGNAPAWMGDISGNKVPTRGILIGSAAGYLAAIAAVWSPNVVFLFLINTSGAIILFIYMIVAFGQIRMRRTLERQGATLPLKMWLFPYLSWAVIAGIVLVLTLMAFEPDLRAQLVWSGLSAAFVGAAYLIRRRSRP